jgi:opacity protein-like surface antigen
MTSLKRVLTQVSVAAAAFSWVIGASAQHLTDRAGKWDFSLPVQYTDSTTLSGDMGSSADIDSAIGWGFGFGYNFNDHWALGMNFIWNEADYSATTTPDAGNISAPLRFSGTLQTMTTSVNATYNFLARALTPFVTAGIGRTWVDTNIPDGPPGTVCWWDPWWGYYCGSTVPTKSEDYWSYNVGAGIRWDAKGPYFLRGMLSRQWVDVGGGIGKPDFTQARIELGLRF